MENETVLTPEESPGIIFVPCFINSAKLRIAPRPLVVAPTTFPVDKLFTAPASCVGVPILPETTAPVILKSSSDLAAIFYLLVD